MKVRCLNTFMSAICDFMFFDLVSLSIFFLDIIILRLCGDYFLLLSWTGHLSSTFVMAFSSCVVIETLVSLRTFSCLFISQSYNNSTKVILSSACDVHTSRLESENRALLTKGNTTAWSINVKLKEKCTKQRVGLDCCIEVSISGN